MNDIVTAIRGILEPLDPEDDPELVPEVTVDDTAAQPLTFRPATLYVYPRQLAETPIETGPTARRDFTVMAVLTGPEAGESADERRSGDVSEFLDARREAYLAAVRANQHGVAWDFLRASEDAGPSNLEVRAIALRLSGYVIV
jgi:hypothetical protein